MQAQALQARAGAVISDRRGRGVVEVEPVFGPPD